MVISPSFEEVFSVQFSESVNENRDENG